MPFGIHSLILVAWTSYCIVKCAGKRAEDTSNTGSSLSLALTKRSHAEVVQLEGGSTAIVHKQAYFGKVNVGTPSQEFTVVFDTGSGNLLIPGQSCGDVACTKHTQFDEKKSSTLKDVSCDPDGGGMDDRLTITFGTGEVSGNCVEDKICLGHLCARGTFIASTTESDHPFASFTFDGVLGLAMDNMAHGPGFGLMQRMEKNSLLAQPIFSVFLSDSDEEMSEVTFGKAPEAHMASDMFWVPVSRDSGYWEVLIDDIAFDNKAQELCTGCYVAVDTGTSELAGPSDVISTLITTLDVKSDCSNFDTLPKLGFVVGSHVLNLEPKDYVNKREGEGPASCDLAMMSLDVPPPKGPLFVFGIPFLQKFFTVYDHANSKVGFALAKHVGGQANLLETLERPAATPKQESASRLVPARRLRPRSHASIDAK